LADYNKEINMFKVLGDPKRAMIIDMLSCGELCACSILEEFDFTQSTLSHHMKLLCSSGLVKARDEGKWTYYFLDPSGVERIKKFLDNITAKKENCICAGCMKNIFGVKKYD
jgi:ArsR family transcriptional regulator